MLHLKFYRALDFFLSFSSLFLSFSIENFFSQFSFLLDALKRIVIEEGNILIFFSVSTKNMKRRKKNATYNNFSQI